VFSSEQLKKIGAEWDRRVQAEIQERINQIERELVHLRLGYVAQFDGGIQSQPCVKCGHACYGKTHYGDPICFHCAVETTRIIRRLQG